MNKPQPHVTTQMNPPNIRQKLDAKVHTLYNSIYIKNKRLGHGCPGGGAWEWTQGLRDAGQGLFLDLGVGYICVFKWYSNFT